MVAPRGCVRHGGDCTLKVWDVRQPHSTLTIPAHEYEILTCDWNKYNDCVIATGSVDRSVKLWDVRNPRGTRCDARAPVRGAAGEVLAARG